MYVSLSNFCIDYLNVNGSMGMYSLNEIRELQRQNNQLGDTVMMMKKELKELKGEV